VLAILFQPLLKIALGREGWNVVDVIVGVGLLVSMFVVMSGVAAVILYFLSKKLEKLMNGIK